MDKPIETSQREPYEPPTVEDVPLRADEQLLAGCKQAGQPGPLSNGTCANPSCQFPGVS